MFCSNLVAGACCGTTKHFVATARAAWCVELQNIYFAKLQKKNYKRKLQIRLR
jgi:hypothetical protein